MSAYVLMMTRLENRVRAFHNVVESKLAALQTYAGEGNVLSVKANLPLIRRHVTEELNGIYDDLKTVNKLKNECDQKRLKQSEQQVAYLRSVLSTKTALLKQVVNEVMEDEFSELEDQDFELEEDRQESFPQEQVHIILFYANYCITACMHCRLTPFDQ